MEGIKELKELVVFIGAFASAADKATQDGLGVEDIAHFVPSLMLAPEAFKGIDAAKLEVTNLDEAELLELKNAFATELDLVDDQLEGLVEEALTIGLQLYGLYKKIGAIRTAV